MKTESVRMFLLLVVLGLLGSAAAGLANEPTAYELIKEGNRSLGEEAKDQVIAIRSEKSIGTLTPTIWYVLYYDPDSPAKATEVKFGAGRKLEVKRPGRMSTSFHDKHLLLNREKLKLDSDKIIDLTSKEPLLNNLKLRATQLWLQRESSDDTPVWKVRVWAAKLRHPDDSVNIGELYLSAEDGKVLKNDLHINRVD